MVDLRPVLSITGILLSLLALAMCLPAVVDLVHDDEDWLVFAASAAVTLFVGLVLFAANREADRGPMTARQIVLLAAAGYLAASLAACLPFAFSELHLSVTDAVFEAVGGLTSTAATVLRSLDAAPPGILLWRALLQWLGGAGFLVMGVTVLPALNIGGMEVLRMDTTAGVTDPMVPRTAKAVIGVTAVYSALTGVLVLLLCAAGMPRFFALVHALTTISCGGFATSDGSIRAWHNPAVDWVVLLGMLMGGAPFVVYLQMVQRRWRLAWRNTQLRWYLGLMLLGTVGIYLWLIFSRDVKPLPALRHAMFAVVSVMTGTGFATVDWSKWSGLAIAILFLLTFVGGCAGSTAGGFKVFRLQILYCNARMQFRRLLEPHAVLVPYYEGQPIPDAAAESVLGFLFVYMMSFAVLAMALGAVGLDFGSAVSASASALANLGPGLSPVVGPMTGYDAVPDIGKWLLAAGMMFGRLEMFIVLVLFSKNFWKA